jgi:hypothetical protein
VGHFNDFSNVSNYIITLLYLLIILVCCPVGSNDPSHHLSNHYGDSFCQFTARDDETKCQTYLVN